MRVVILSEAEADLDDCYHFYEDREEGVGEYFLDSWQLTFDRFRFLLADIRLSRATIEW